MEKLLKLLKLQSRIKHMGIKNFVILTCVFLCTSLGITPIKVFAQEQNTFDAQKTYEGIVKNVIEESKNNTGGYYQQLEIEITNHDLIGKTLNVQNGSINTPVSQKYSKGDGLVLSGYTDEKGEIHVYVNDYIRRGQLISLFLIFLAIAIAVGGKRSITSFIGMGITFFIIFSIVLPKISAGLNPTFIIILFSIISIPITFYLSHGVNTKTSVAIAGTFISLVITIILSTIYVESAKLTGYTTDEASFFQIMKGGTINMKGILLAGIIIGFLGVLDDITVSQSAIVFQLKKANKRLSFSELYSRSMDIGKDHIASMINTLILVYAGASLPLLLLFTDTTKSFNEVINYEIIASEVIRTLLGSIGLIIAVPITTLIAVIVTDNYEGDES